MSLPLSSGKRTADTTGDVFIPANGVRKGIYLSNTDVQTTFFSFTGAAVVDEGVDLGLREKTLIQDLDTVKNEIRMITASGTAVISFQEF